MIIMKKKYIAPELIMVMMKHDMGILCGSVLSDIGIDYGGVDVDGIIDSDSRVINGVIQDNNDFNDVFINGDI
jgi:hypothetical protein